MNRCYRKYCWFVLLMIIAGRLSAQDSPGIYDVRPFVRNDSLGCSYACPALFTGKVEQTLLSGLPVLLKVRFRISGSSGFIESPPPVKYKVSYDIWEDRFLLESPEKEHFFSTLKALREWWNPRESGIVPLKKLINHENELNIECGIQVILLTRSQSQKMKEWILNTAETEEDIPSMSRDTGFKLNLNQVVSLFLNKSDTGESFEVRGESDTFKIDDLSLKK